MSFRNQRFAQSCERQSWIRSYLYEGLHPLPEGHSGSYREYRELHRRNGSGYIPGDDKTTSAVVRKLEIIGEAVEQIPEEVRQKHPQVPWKEMAGMRDKLIHFYFGVDHQLVWRAVTERLPHVKQEIEKALRSTD